ncbi:hypothetical protein BC832DRAFT_123825 [Gaertneriomyces semiglobifer]|nr:hypothetical protein BC832DRAFT_123825 [Gaertneriomyces semiglobifer]
MGGRPRCPQRLAHPSACSATAMPAPTTDPRATVIALTQLDAALAESIREIAMDDNGLAATFILKEFLLDAKVFDKIGGAAAEPYVLKWMKIASSFENPVSGALSVQVYAMLSEKPGHAQEAFEALQNAVKWQCPQAGELMGNIYEFGKFAANGQVLFPPNQFARALEMYMMPCPEELEVPEFLRQTGESQYRASMILKNGYGDIPPNPALSLQWIYRAAANLSISAVYSIGMRRAAQIANSAPNARWDKEHFQAIAYLEFAHEWGPSLNDAEETFLSATLDTMRKGAYMAIHTQYTKDNAPAGLRVLIPNPQHTVEELLELARVWEYHPQQGGNVVAMRQFALLSAATKDNANASYELGRYYRFHANKNGTDPSVAMKKAVSFYFDAASRGHVLGLLACAHSLEIDEPFQVAAYEILRRGGDPAAVARLPEIQALLAKLTPPFERTDEFLRREKADYAKAMQARGQIETVTKKKEKIKKKNSDCTIM